MSLGISILLMIAGCFPFAVGIAAEGASHKSLGWKLCLTGAALWIAALGFGIAYVEQHRGDASP